MENENLYWIWFQTLFGIGTRRSELLMDYFDHPRAIYEGIRERSQVLGMLTGEEAEASETAFGQSQEILRRTERKGCQVITTAHPDYPPLLKKIYDRPAVLYAKGDLSCLREGLAITMVGTRKRTPYGAEAAAALAEQLARQGVVVVSGLAPGIDTESHRGALVGGGKTVGVLGCGIDVDYPKSSRTLKTDVSRCGAVITEFPLGYPPLQENFPIRNRILSGMTNGTLVVEADLQSGSLITARLAREQGRDIFAVPGPIFQQGERGTHLLIKEGARLTDCVEDILAVYADYVFPGQEPPRPDPPAKPAGKRKKKPVEKPTDTPKKRELPEGIGEEAKALYACFGQGTLTADDLVPATGLGAGSVLSALTELELYGLIQSYPGRRFGLLE